MSPTRQKRSICKDYKQQAPIKEKNEALRAPSSTMSRQSSKPLTIESTRISSRVCNNTVCCLAVMILGVVVEMTLWAFAAMSIYSLAAKKANRHAQPMFVLFSVQQNVFAAIHKQLVTDVERELEDCWFHAVLSNLTVC
eukprot:5687579-Amphidinium_carterae.6